MGSLKLENIRKSFGKVDVLKGIDLEITDGEFVVFVGPSGCGKSTLLRVIAGLEDASSGNVVIDGKSVVGVPPADRGIAMVFQTYALYPHLTVKNNMSLGIKQAGAPAEEIARRVAGASAMLSLDPYLERRPAELSGGQRQRVAIGRALVRKPAIYLMDEPLSSLDAKLRAELRLELKRIQAELGSTVLYVTHDQIEAMTMADRIGILADGVMVQIGSPKTIYREPANLHVAARLGQPAINLIPVGLLPDAAVPAGTKTIGARTEHLTIEKSANGHSDGVIDWVEHLGDQNHLHLTVRDRKLITLTDTDTPFRKGDAVTVRYRAPLFFDGSGNRISG